MNDQAQDPALEIDPSILVPGQSIDCVIIGHNQQGLNILVLKWKGADLWALPGGFIHKNEDMDSAAARILEERTGLALPFLHQFHTFGDVNQRDNRSVLDKLLSKELDQENLKDWFMQRFISTGYLSLVQMNDTDPKPDFMSEICQWRPLTELPELMLDHKKIVSRALKQIRNQINYLPVGISLLPEKFTMKEFQYLYESILQRALDRANFQKKMLKLGFLNRHEKQHSGGAHKAPYLYSFDPEKYRELMEKGIGFL